MLSIQKNRYDQLEKLMEQAYELITEYQNYLLVTQSPKEKLKFRSELEDTRQYLKEFKAELSELENEIKSNICDTMHVFLNSYDIAISNTYMASIETITTLLQPAHGLEMDV